MMKLTIMRDFVEKEVSKREKSVVSTILERWGSDKGTDRLLRCSNNFIFTFVKDGTKYILRLTDVEKVKQGHISAELDFLRFLSENGILVNTPIKSLAGNDIEVVETSVGTFYAVVLNFLEGKLFDFEEIDESQFSLWGEALGNLHYMSNKYKKEDNNIESCFDHLNVIKELLPSHEYSAQKELATIENWLNNLKKKDKNYGLNHFDFELDNIIWHENKLQLIDFDSCAYYWYTADIAFALRDLFTDGCDLTNKYFLSFIGGYRKRMDIDEECLSDIPMFLRFHNLLTFVKLQKSIDIDMSCIDANPKWIADLADKLENKIKELREQFENYYN